MTRDELEEMIRNEVRAAAFEELRSSKKNKEKKKKAFKPRGLSEEELDYDIFYGGNKPEKETGKKSYPITIKETYDSGIPKINSSEITLFEDSFEEMLKDVDGASVVFDKQDNGYSLKMFIGKDGIEAGASGVIHLGNKGKLNWSYSLRNGLNVSTENMVIEKGNKNLLEKLFNHYDSWQKDWREKLTIQPGQESQEETEPAPSAGEMAPEPGGEVGAPGGEVGGVPEP